MQQIIGNYNSKEKDDEDERNSQTLLSVFLSQDANKELKNTIELLGLGLRK